MWLTTINTPILIVHVSVISHAVSAIISLVIPSTLPAIFHILFQVAPPDEVFYVILQVIVVRSKVSDFSMETIYLD